MPNGDLEKRTAKYNELLNEGWILHRIEPPKRMIMKRDNSATDGPDSWEYLALKANGTTSEVKS